MAVMCDRRHIGSMLKAGWSNLPDLGEVEKKNSSEEQNVSALTPSNVSRGRDEHVNKKTCIPNLLLCQDAAASTTSDLFSWPPSANAFQTIRCRSCRGADLDNREDRRTGRGRSTGGEKLGEGGGGGSWRQG
jgi:hypothetical protein